MDINQINDEKIPAKSGSKKIYPKKKPPHMTYETASSYFKDLM